MKTETLSGHILRPFLAAIRLWPRRLLLDIPGAQATVPMVRGVWGAALNQLDPGLYTQVFDPPAPAVPLYLLRPAPFDPQTAPALDWLLFADAIEADSTLRRAWDIASGRGLDKQRLPFVIRHFLDLAPDGTPAPRGPWRLSDAAWPLANDAPCRLEFPAPLRLRRDQRLIEQPTLADLTVAAHRRVAAFLPEEQQAEWRRLLPDLLEAARRRPGRWQGRRLDLHRWSASQQAEIDLRGVSGLLELPQGVGELAPLLAAGVWLHLGKGTVLGLGQMDVGAD